MYGTTETGTMNRATFSVYKSLDLENFEQPITVFDGNKSDFWTKKHYCDAMSFVDLDGQRKIALHSPNEVSENLMIIPFNRRDY